MKEPDAEFSAEIRLAAWQSHYRWLRRTLGWLLGGLCMGVFGVLAYELDQPAFDAPLPVVAVLLGAALFTSGALELYRRGLVPPGGPVAESPYARVRRLRRASTPELTRQLREALAAEHYERAVHIRDILTQRHGKESD